MPQKKNCIPWNKGLSSKNDPRIKWGVRKYILTDEIKETIIKLYSEYNTIKQISHQLSIGEHCIVSFLNSSGIRRSCSEARKIIAQQKKQIIQNSYYQNNDIELFVVSGYIHNGALGERSILLLKCEKCYEEFKRDYFGYKSGIKHSKQILCRNCALIKSRENKDGRSIKKSIQQQQIHSILGGEINYKISGIFVDIALINDKVIVEYDGWFWHKNSKNKDRKRDEFLKSLGWKILRIKGGRNIPSENELKIELELLKNSQNRYREIVMKDWIGYEEK